MIEDWQGKAILSGIPIILAVGAWSLSLESRIQVIGVIQQERTSRIDAIEKTIQAISEQTSDPRPKPETRVEMMKLSQDVERLKDDIGKINERINNLHSFLMQAPSLRPPFAPGNSRRGDLIFEYPQRQP